MAELAVVVRAELPDGEARGFTVGGHEIVLCSVEGEIYALQGSCTHQELPLDGCEVEHGVLTCEWHGATFDVRSGRVLGPPATRRLRTFLVRVDDDGIVWVDLPS